MNIDNIFLILELIGTCAFAVSGAMVSINKNLDIFGVLFCAVTTAMGGGLLRDTILNNLPPYMFRKYIYLLFAVVSALIVFICASVFRNKYVNNQKTVDMVNNIFDAVGLGVFTVTGINTALLSVEHSNSVFIIFLGMLTGCGGGMLRDIFVRDVPFILSKRVYAVASICGGILYYYIYIYFNISEIIASVICIAVIFLIRILASVFRWNLPKAI